MALLLGIEAWCVAISADICHSGFVSYFLEIFGYLTNKLLFISYAELNENIAQRTNSFDKIFHLSLIFHGVDGPHRLNSLTFTRG